MDKKSKSSFLKIKTPKIFTNLLSIKKSKSIKLDIKLKNSRPIKLNINLEDNSKDNEDNVDCQHLDTEKITLNKE